MMWGYHYFWKHPFQRGHFPRRRIQNWSLAQIGDPPEAQEFGWDKLFDNPGILSQNAMALTTNAPEMSQFQFDLVALIILRYS